MKRRFISIIAVIVTIAVLVPCINISAAANSVLLGDINNDGKVDAEDALHILRYSVLLETLRDDQLAAADVNGDNKIDSLDALLALRISVGLIESSTDDNKQGDYEEYAYEILELANKARAKANLAPLSLDTKLCMAADTRAEEISYKFDHIRIDGRNWDTILDDYNIKSKQCGENIAAGFTTSESVFELWMKSDGHRENILSPKFNKLGVGYYFNKNSRYGYYWTMNFTD